MLTDIPTYGENNEHSYDEYNARLLTDDCYRLGHLRTVVLLHSWFNGYVVMRGVRKETVPV